MSEDRDAAPDDGAGEDIDLNVDADGNDSDDGEDLDLGPEPEPEPEPSEEPEPRRQQQQDRDRHRPGRSARLAQQLQSERSQNADLARRLAALEQQRSAPPPIDPREQAREEAQFRENLQNMLPHEAALAVADRERARTQQMMQQVALSSFDRSDGAEYRQLRQSNRAAERLASRVEQVLTQRRQMGDYTLGRRDILAYLVGQEVLDGNGAGAARQRTQAAARVAGQQARPVNGRGDVAAPAGRRRGTSQEDADIALLRGTNTNDL